MSLGLPLEREVVLTMKLSSILKAAPRPWQRANVRPCGLAGFGCPPDRARFVALPVTSVRDDGVGTVGSSASELCLMLTIAIWGLSRGGPVIAGRRRPNSAGSRKAELLGSAAEGRIGLGRSFFNSRDLVPVRVARAAAKNPTTTKLASDHLSAIMSPNLAW
jgi:hypothetical protein